MALLKEFSVQLYTLRNENEKLGFDNVIRRVAELGFTGVEYAGYNGISAPEMKALLAETGLAPVGSHVSMQRLEDDLAGEIAYAKEIGLPNIIIPAYQLQSAADVQALAAKLGEMAPAILEAGLQLGYHNHAHEFEKDENGTYLLDLLLDTVPEKLLFLELDVYWAAYAGVDIAAYLKKHAGRIRLLHIKQMKDYETRACVDLDKGVLDFAAIIATAKALGTKDFVLEQESPDENASLWEGVRNGLEYIYSL